jgi:hypothetical protein
MRLMVLVVTGTLAGVQGPDAAVFRVLNNRDSGAGSLRQVIALANSNL